MTNQEEVNCKFCLYLNIKKIFGHVLEQVCATYGQMWPAEASSLARKAQSFVHLACLFYKTHVKW